MMNKRITNFIIAVALVTPGLVCAFEQKQDGIVLKVTDYAHKSGSVLGYTPDGALTSEKFLAKGIHPVRITIKNDTDKPVMISGRSMRLKSLDQQTLVDVFQKGETFTSSIGWDHVLAGGLTMVTFKMLTGSCWPITSTIVTFWSYKLMTHKNEVLSKVLMDLSVQEELRYPEMIKPGTKITKLFLIDETAKKNKKFEFLVFDEKHEESVAKFEIKLA